MDYLISEIDKPKQAKQNKRQKIVTFLNKRWGLIAFFIMLIFNYFTWLSPFHTRDNTSFFLEEEVVRIPLIIRNHQSTYVVINNNSVRMVIDTGMSGSQLCYSVPATFTLGRTRMIDGGGLSRRIPIRRVREMQWGGLTINNLQVVQDPNMSLNLIGDNILRHFIVQFDSQNQEIVLTQNPTLIEKRGIRVSFSRGRRNSAVIVTLSLNGKEGDFLLDTGYTGELRVGADFFYSSGLSDLKNVKWRGRFGGAVFMPDYRRSEMILYRTTADSQLGERVFENTIVAHCPNWHVNVIGVAFLQRFRTVTIDYLNEYVYFELPEDNSFISFSDNPIEVAPVASLGFVFNSINSFGVEILRSYPYTIRRLRKNSVFAEKGIDVGDTLVGINQLIFNETVFGELKSERGSFYLETNRSRQRTAINDVFFRTNKATFHFLKNGELISIEDVRDNILYSPPKFAYSFDSVLSPFAFRAIPVKPNFYLQIVPSTLVGREKYFSVFRDGVETIISNNPDAPNPFLDNEN